MSAHYDRRRTRKLGKPLFPIEDPDIDSAPTQPLAELTADLDTALADRVAELSEPGASISLRVPDDVRAAFQRARQSARAASASGPRVQPRPSCQSAVPAEPRNDRVTASSGAPRRYGDRLASPPPDRMSTGAGGRSDGRPTVAATTSRAPQSAVRAGVMTVELARNDRGQPAHYARPAMVEEVAKLPRTGSDTLTYVPAVALETAILPLPNSKPIETMGWAAWMNQPLVQFFILAVSVVVLILWWVSSSPVSMLSYQYARGENWRAAANSVPMTALLPMPGDYRLRTGPSLSPAQIDEILRSYGSPATGTGEIWYRLGLKYEIDPAYAVAFFIHESSAGTNPAWAGRKPDGSTTHNVGNIICAGYHSCYGRFRDYPDWETGIADWYRLIDVEYIRGRGLQTVAEVIPIYAPAFENDVQNYINVVTSLVDRWRAGNIP